MAESLKLLIVDDELNNRVVLEKMLQLCIPVVLQIYQAANIEEAVIAIEMHNPAIVYLDIQMQEESGFDLLQRLPDYEFQVIFVTAHDNYALKAFRFNAVDYLLKPVLANELKESFYKAMNRPLKHYPAARENINRLYQQLANETGLVESISIATAEGFLVLPVKDILYCQASSNYTNIHIRDGKKILSSQTLGYYEDLLNGHHFFRAHRSYLINLIHVSSYRKGEAGFITLSNGDEVELSRNNRNNFMQLFKG